MSPLRLPSSSFAAALLVGACSAAPQGASARRADAGGAGDDGGAVGGGGMDAGREGADASGGPAGEGGTGASCADLVNAAAASSQWVTVDPSGKLAYKPTPKGDTILDFSSAGYMGGGVAPPTVPSVQALTPSGGDDTAAIQAALDAVAKMPPDGHGLRGAVQLSAGTFTLAGSLTMTTGGVVLRGSGSGPQGTLLEVTGNPRMIIDVHGATKWTTTGAPIAITDAYVPSGARTFHVASTAGIVPGTKILVQRPVTQAWVDFMGMNTLVRNGMPQTWIPVGSVIRTDRVVTAVGGKAVTVDVPLADSYDAQYLSPPGASIQAYTDDGRIAQVGIESMRVSAPPMTTAINQATFLLLSMDGVIDGWLRDIAADGFINGLQVGGHAKRITVDGVAFTHTAPINGSSGYPADFSVAGEQVLLVRCSSQGDHVFSLVTQAETTGPNVVTHFTATGTSTNMAPHQRWATGLLLDDVDSPTGGIDLMNRATAGSGQGWAIGWGVVWNAVAADLLVEQPPGSQNWAIGSSGTLQPGTDGAIDSHGVAVEPSSLYLAQLCDRLGAQAVHAIGF